MVEITLILKSQSKLGHPLTSPKRTHQILTIADTGSQTCSSRPEILKTLKCLIQHLIPTNHKIHGITKDQLNIKSILFIHIQMGLKETKQIMYVSDYIESALKNLDLIHPIFSNPVSWHNAATSISRKAACGCLQRTAVLKSLPPKQKKQQPLSHFHLRKIISTK